MKKIHDQVDASKRTHQLKLLFKGNITVKYQDNKGNELKESATLAQSGNFIRVNEEGNLSETNKDDQLVKTHKVFENGNVLEIVDNKIVKAYKVDRDGKTIKTYVVDENGDIFASDEEGKKIQELKLYKLVKEDRVEKVLNPETNKEEEKTIHEEYLARLDKDGKVAGKYNKKHLIIGKDKPEDLLEISNKIGFYYDSTSEYLRTIKKDGVTYRLSKAHRGGVTATSNRPSGVLSSVNTTVTYLYDEVARAKVQVRERDDNGHLFPVDDQDDFILESLVGKEFPAEAVNEKIAELKKKWYSVSSDFGNGKTRVADNVSDVEDNISQIYTIIVGKPKVRFVTEWIDVNGKQLKPSEEGEQDKGRIPNYVFLETIKTRHKITHVFMADEPIAKPIIEITGWLDKEGNVLKPYEVGKKGALEFNGYRFVKTTTDDGITIHLYEKIQKPIIPATPEIPTPPTPEIPNPQPNPVEPQPEPEKPRKPELPNTGTETNAGVTVLGLLAALSGIGLVTRKKEEYEN